MSNHQRLWAPLIALLLAAFFLRVLDVDQQSVWYDEGLSIQYARDSFVQMVREVSQSEHPPLYPLLLRLWIRLCGDTELSVRMLSVWWGVLAVALTYRLGRRFTSLLQGLGALLLAVSPFAIWYSQEARGYTQAMALVLAVVNLGVKLLPGRPDPDTPRSAPRYWLYVVYVILATAALYTHIYSALVLLVLNLVYLGQLLHLRWSLLRPKPRAVVLRWIAAQVGVIVLFAPWLPSLLRQLAENATYWHGAVDWEQIIARTFTAYSVGETLSGPWAIGGTLALSLLGLLGIYALSRRRPHRWAVGLLVLWILVPLLFQIALNRTRPKFAPRYLLSSLPAYLLLAGVGQNWLFRAARQRAFHPATGVKMILLLTTTALIGGATTRSLGNVYFDERFSRPDFRAVAHHIGVYAEPDDLIVLLGGHSRAAFTYYYRGPLPVLPLPDRLLPTTQEPVDLAALPRLDQAIAGRRRLWLVLWQADLADPTGLIVDELQHTYPRLGVGETFHGLSLLLFDVSSGPLLAQGATPRFPVGANLGGQVKLIGYDLSQPTIDPGGTLYLYLYWEGLVDIRHDYKVFTQVLDPSGTVIAQDDQIAGAATYPTSHWRPGDVVRQRFMLTLEQKADPGTYFLIAGLYRSDPGLPRLSAHGKGARGDHIALTEVEVRGK